MPKVVMLTGMDEPLHIRPAPPERHLAGLGLLFSGLSAEERSAQMALTLAAVRRGVVSTDGLLVAERVGQIVGVVWANAMGGRSALVWPPQLADDEAEATVGELLQAADAWMRSQGIMLSTAYLAEGDSLEARRLEAARYEKAAVISYLVSDSDEFPEGPPTQRVEFVPFAEREWQRLITVVDATYVGTRDCPRLNGVRQTRDVLEGYRTSSGRAAAQWFIVEQQGGDVGCLLLADHAEENHFELVYMGVTPAARGCGLGTEITRHAQWLCRYAGRASLVLAVDAENEPALRGYAACGFRQFDRRSVLLKSLLPEGPECGQAT